MDSGVAEDHIIEIALDDRSNKELRDPDVILKFIKESIKDKEDYYIILDEVQYLDEFEDVLNSLLHIRNADVYVTGSNSKFLSSDVITQFRGRGDEIRVYPLSFSEYVSVYQGSQDEAWDDYLVYGGLPLILTMEEAEDKAEYLNSLFQKVYISDIVERHNVRNKAELDELVDVLASAIGSYTNQSKLVRTFKSVKNKSISDKTIKNYTDYLIDSYLISKADRYDIKGKKQLEVDFVATKGSEKYYIQSAFALPTADKVNQEQRGLLRISDFFRKIVVVGDNIKVRRDENGIITIGLRNYLLDENSLKL